MTGTNPINSVDLRGSVALITGASRGIGRACAISYAKQGCHVALLARTESGLEETARLCREEGARSFVLPTDLTDTEAIKRAVTKTVEVFGRLDVLVNNAGQNVNQPIDKADLERWDRVIDLNLRAAYHLTHFAAPHLVESPRSAVINISSIAGKMSWAGSGAYSGSKHGLIGLSGAIYEDLRERGVKVCVICPGWVDTDMADSPKLDPEKMIRPADVANAALFVTRFGEHGCPTEIVIKPQRSPYQ